MYAAGGGWGLPVFRPSQPDWGCGMLPACGAQVDRVEVGAFAVPQSRSEAAGGCCLDQF